jgi:hypothetical protein
MGKPIRSNNINENYYLYENLLKSSKKLLSPIIIINKDRDKDMNHVGSLKRKVPVLIDLEEDCYITGSKDLYFKNAIGVANTQFQTIQDYSIKDFILRNVAIIR